MTESTAAKKEEEEEGQGGGGEAMDRTLPLQPNTPGPCTSIEQQSTRQEAGGSQQPGKMVRNASGSGEELHELFLRMEPGIRVSRFVRAEWLMEHLTDRNVDETAVSNQKGLSVFGSDAKSTREARLRVGPGTAVTFLADSYRLVFVLDLSPSCFVIDDLGCVLYSRLVQCLRKCLKNLVAKANIPGAQCEFRPRICISICTFSPFICFPEENVLLQGVIVNAQNVEQLLTELMGQLNQYIDRLVLFSQPHMREWSLGRRRGRSQRHTDEAAPPVSFRSATEKQQSGSDRGFIQPDWALIFMLRMGLMGIQMMGHAGRSLASIVLITDGVCGVFDQLALQGALSQLRLNAVSCTFVQLRPASLRGPVLGHVGFPELFQFIATATFGSFLFEDELDGPAEPENSVDDILNPVQRALLTWAFYKKFSSQQSPHFGDDFQMRSSNVRNKYFSRTYEASLARLLAIRLREGFSLCQLDELQQSAPNDMRGDKLLTSQSATTLLIRLSLAWRPQISIDYQIYAPRHRRGQRKVKLRVDIFVEAQLHSSMGELLGDRHDPASLRSALISLREADALLMHLNSFNSESYYWELPKEIDRSVALFEVKKGSQRLALADRYEALRNSKFISYWQPLSNIDEALWQRWMHTHAVRLVLAPDMPLPERIFTAQSKGRFGQCSAEMAFNELHNHLKRWASFALVRDQTYVCLLHEEHSECRAKKGSSGLAVPTAVPDQFCLIRTSLDIPCVLVRLCFPPGVSGQTRDEVLAQFSDSLGRLRIVHESQWLPLSGDSRAVGVNPAGSNQTISSTTAGSSNRQQQQLVTKTMEVPSVCLFQKPFERVLVHYKAVPRELHRIVRLERTESASEKREMVLHNATAKYLSCRRQVWRMRGIFMKNAVPALASLEFILQTLLRLRLRQGFQLAWSKGGIVNLIRQVNSMDGRQPQLEQCVLFGPTMGPQQQMEEGRPRHVMANRQCSLMMMNIVPPVRRSSLCGDEEVSDKYGTLESTKHAPASSITAAELWPQIVTEVWNEPTKQCIGAEQQQNGVEKSRRAVGEL